MESLDGGRRSRLLGGSSFSGRSVSELRGVGPEGRVVSGRNFSCEALVCFDCPVSPSCVAYVSSPRALCAGQPEGTIEVH